MNFLGTIHIKGAIIHVWEDSEGKIILGGLFWYEFNAYEKLKEKKIPMKKIIEEPIMDLYYYFD